MGKKAAAVKAGIPKYTIRVSLMWVIPVFNLLFGQFLLGPFLLAGLATPVEVPKIRTRVCGAHTKKQLPCLKVPALMRLSVLWVLQAWWCLLQRADSSLSTLPDTALEPVDPSLAWQPTSFSVVLPCAGEGEFSLNTVKAVHESTPAELLREIIVVDDGSDPPLGTSHLTEEVRERYGVRLIRHSETQGLIASKKDGGDAAAGDVVVFFDCHVAPQPGWHKSFVSLIAANYRRIVVPVITDLDVGTWRQRGGGRGQSKCYVTWDADFKWFDSADPYVPVLSGGLLGISKRWWNETGGYDEKMAGWGGENLDQSLRSWLCGGEIMIAKDSFVAHMWRSPSDPRTAPKYTVKPGSVVVNRARAAVAWFGEFSTKLGSFPGLAGPPGERPAEAPPWYGDIGNILEVRDRLKCKSFAWFLRRFKEVYEDGGLVPPETFGIQVVEGGKCLTYQGPAGTSQSGAGKATLEPCVAGNERQRWHPANRDWTRQGQCCSGLRAWNTDQCIIGATKKFVKTFVCDIAGQRSEQLWELGADGQLRRRGKNFLGDACIVPQADGTVQEGSCGQSPVWSKEGASEPPELLLYRKALETLPE